MAQNVTPEMIPPIEPGAVASNKELDTIKLFVGQIPRSWGEEEVREIMESFGPVYDISVLKDKMSQQAKGCAFVTYCNRTSAINAQKQLHEKKTLAGMHHPMQVKPAMTDHKGTPPSDRRLFVGMLSRNMTEEEVRAMFGRFGVVEDVSILRTAEGGSKGAAFVRMATKSEALQAITALHQSETLPGCSSPLVVKIADTEREKVAKKQLQAMATMTQTFPYINAYQQAIMQGASGTANNSFGLGLGTDLSLQSSAGAAAAAGYGTGVMGLGNLGSAALGAAIAAGNKPGSIAGLTSDSIMQAYLGMHSAFPGAIHPQQTQQQATSAMYLHMKQKEGPEGSNLFIYHLPNDVTDTDLIQMFQPFGTVVSAKVFIDKVTNLSKCFGFISYDNNMSAHSAIQAMNGFQIGTKRLKVQLKRPKDSNKPY